MIMSISKWFLWDFVIGLFAFLDSIVYGIFSLFVRMVFVINDMLSTNDVMNQFGNRFYILVGVFALFKLTFTFLNALVNPDKLTDKKEGAGNIIQRTIVSVIMLLALPMVFDKLYKYQNDIIQAIPAIILGREIAKEDQKDLADAVALTTFSAWVFRNTDCADSGNNGNTGIVNFEMSDSGFIADTADIVTTGCKDSSGKTIYKYNYWFILSTICGIIMIIIFIPVCIDVVVRSFKLIVLYLIAPLPIISYIDPKSSSGGMFDSWLKLTIKTYISIFLTLASVYFVLAVLSTLLGSIF